MVTATANVKRLKRRSIVAAAFLLLLAAFVLALVYFAVVPRLRSGGSFAGAAIAAVYLGYAIWAVRDFARMRPRVVPYFTLKYFRSEDPSRKTAEESWKAFRGGEAIAADLAHLDDVARQLGVAPLSDFGFGDDLMKQAPQWSDIDDGLRTLAALAAAPSLAPATRADLETLAAALGKARLSQNRFCLIVRYGRDDYISGVEMGKRQGTFWCSATPVQSAPR